MTVYSVHGVTMRNGERINQLVHAEVAAETETMYRLEIPNGLGVAVVMKGGRYGASTSPIEAWENFKNDAKESLDYYQGEIDMADLEIEKLKGGA